MPTIRSSVVVVCIVAAAACISVAVAADTATGTSGSPSASEARSPGTPPNAGAAAGAMPGDEVLTCEQIYAQGMAESQRDQQERSRRNDQMRAQSRETTAMITGAVATGGLGGTGQMAQAAAEAQTNSQMALLSAPQSNPRMDHLKQLWAQKHCVKK